MASLGLLSRQSHFSTDAAIHIHDIAHGKAGDFSDPHNDFNAADELLTTFKQIRTAKAKETADVGQQVRKQNLKAAAVDVSGTGESSKKVYRRADLIRLRMTDPARYDALQDEIMAAYAEGRVK